MWEDTGQLCGNFLVTDLGCRGLRLPGTCLRPLAPPPRAIGSEDAEPPARSAWLSLHCTPCCQRSGHFRHVTCCLGPVSFLLLALLWQPGFSPLRTPSTHIVFAHPPPPPLRATPPTCQGTHTPRHHAHVASHTPHTHTHTHAHTGHKKGASKDRVPLLAVPLRRVLDPSKFRSNMGRRLLWFM